MYYWSFICNEQNAMDDCTAYHLKDQELPKLIQVCQAKDDYITDKIRPMPGLAWKVTFDSISESHADGNNNQQHLVIEKYKKPYCFKNVIMFFMDYEANL